MPLTNKVSLANLQVGDYVWCKYTALTSGQYGSFSDIATKTDATATPLIPAASSATPNGYFKLIKVGTDFLGRDILIADRNVQHSISWDNLNINGVSSGSGLPIKIDNNNESQIKYTTRLLTGGVSAADNENEWSKYIGNSTLNGTVTAGDPNVWGLSSNLASWTSTTLSTADKRILYYGAYNGQFVGYIGAHLTNSADISDGFRPALLIETFPPSFTGSVDKTSIHSDDVVLSGTISDPSSGTVQYRIKVNGVQEYPVSGYTALSPSPLGISYTIPNNKLHFGTNQIALEILNASGVGNAWSATVTLNDQSPSITAAMTGMKLNATIGDPESDMVKYQVKLNGIKIYPIEIDKAYTDLASVPVIYSKTFRSSEINIGANNTVIITAQDSYGVSNTVTLNFIGAYSGLMFSDASGTLFSDDMGHILKYLDFGTIIAGQTSLDAKVLLKNTNSFDVNNIILWSEHAINGLTVELSKSNAPFVAQTQLIFNQTVTTNQTIEFYVRLTADLTAVGGGSFDIKTKSGVV